MAKDIKFTIRLNDGTIYETDFNKANTENYDDCQDFAFDWFEDVIVKIQDVLKSDEETMSEYIQRTIKTTTDREQLDKERAEFVETRRLDQETIEEYKLAIVRLKKDRQILREAFKKSIQDVDYYRDLAADTKESYSTRQRQWEERDALYKKTKAEYDSLAEELQAHKNESRELAYTDRYYLDRYRTFVLDTNRRLTNLRRTATKIKNRVTYSKKTKIEMLYGIIEKMENVPRP